MQFSVRWNWSDRGDPFWQLIHPSIRSSHFLCVVIQCFPSCKKTEKHCVATQKHGCTFDKHGTTMQSAALLRGVPVADHYFILNNFKVTLFFSSCYIVWLGVVQPQNIGAIFILSSGSAKKLKLPNFTKVTLLWTFTTLAQVLTSSYLLRLGAMQAMPPKMKSAAFLLSTSSLAL